MLKIPALVGVQFTCWHHIYEHMQCDCLHRFSEINNALNTYLLCARTDSCSYILRPIYCIPTDNIIIQVGKPRGPLARACVILYYVFVLYIVNAIADYYNIFYESFKCCVDYCYYNRKMAVSRAYWTTTMSTPTDVALTLCKKMLSIRNLRCFACVFLTGLHNVIQSKVGNIFAQTYTGRIT